MRWWVSGLVIVVLGGVVLGQDVMRNGVSSATRLGPALAAWIQQTRDDAIERGVERMPADFREAFEGYVDSAVLDRVRWRVDAEASLLGSIFFQSGSVRAITLDHVILFANEEEAGNIKLWAHELFHVMQYERWGIDGFAERFIADHRSIEREALEFRWSWMKATDRIPN